MRLATLALALAACAAPPPPAAEGDYTRVMWKAGTTLDTRAADAGACEFRAIGATAAMPQARIRDLAAATAPELHHDRYRACMIGRGYTLSEFAICTPEQRARGRLLQMADVARLPPPSTVVCFDAAMQAFIPG